MSSFFLIPALLAGTVMAGPREAPRALQERIEDMEPGASKSRAELELVDALRERGFLNSARAQAVSIAARGPDDTGFPYAVARVLELDADLRNPLGLSGVMAKVESDQLPAFAVNAVALHQLSDTSLGRSERGDIGSRISVASDAYGPARLILGDIGYGCLKPMVMNFREAMTATSGTEDTKDRGLFRVAATYAGLQRYDLAASYYAEMDPNAYFYAAARCEEAAAYLAPGVPNGNGAGVQDVDAAEAAIAAARTAEHPDAELPLQFLDAFTHGWNSPELEVARQQAIALGVELADAQAFFAEDTPVSVGLGWFADASTREDPLGRLLRGHVARNAPLRQTLEALIRLEEEEARLGRERRLPTDLIRLDHRRARAAYQDRAARLIAEGLASEHAHVERLRLLADAIQLDLEWDFYATPELWYTGDVFCRPGEPEVPEFGLPRPYTPNR